MSRAVPLVLVVEDEQRIADILIDYLNQSGFATRHVGDGRVVLDVVDRERPDLILLDVMLPGRDGIALCRDIRQTSQVPIIMATARVEELDRLLCLELGADDYICKPYSPREVVARVKAVLRRTTSTCPAAGDGLHIDAEAQRATFAGHRLDLTRTEFQILRLLAARPGRVYARSQILELAYDDDQDVSDRVVDSHIKNLRRKLAAVAGAREFIHAVYGVGYRFEHQ